ncbi:MAG: hypothetical protein WC480_03860 [Patescibacteria group bacterium]
MKKLYWVGSIIFLVILSGWISIFDASATDIDLGLENVPSCDFCGEDMRSNIAIIANRIFGGLIIFFLIITLISSIYWLTKRKNPDQAKKAKKIIKIGLLGLVVIMILYVVASYTINYYLNNYY